jgi:protein-tyrosine phosphatase
VIDLHTHLLPGVDDGARSGEQAVQVLERMAASGVTDVCLTPHLLASALGRGVPSTHDRAHAALTKPSGKMPRLHRGAEVMLDRPIERGVASERTATLGGSRYMLVEFPRLAVYGAVIQALGRVIEIGLIPVLAHPERYACCSVGAARRWKELGALMQVDATTLLSLHGRGNRARRLVEEGLADILASDNHGDTRMMTGAVDLLIEQNGDLQATLLTERNPGAMLADEALEPVPPFQIRTSWIQRMRGLLEREDR